jgi:hypothetical protein
MPKPKKTKESRCCSCGRRFLPDHRARNRQRFCRQPECRRASRAASRARWLAKPENAHYFKGAANAMRVRLWRAANPRPKKAAAGRAMQRLIQPQLAAALKACGVQDMSERQLALLLGVVSALAHSGVQDVIARKMRRLMFAGYAVLRPDDTAPAQYGNPKRTRG